MVRCMLDEILDRRKMTRYLLSQKSGVPYQTVDRYYKNTVVRYDGYILSKFCEVLGCTPGDLLVYVPDEPEE